MKTILVAGGAGFIGSHLCQRLVEQGHRVFAVDWLALVRSIRKNSGQKDDWTSGIDIELGKAKLREQRMLAVRTGLVVAPQGAPKNSPNYSEKPHKTPLRRRIVRRSTADALLPGTVSLGNV